MSGVVEFTDRKCYRMEVARGWGLGIKWGKLVFNGSRVSVLEDEKFWSWMVVTLHNNVNVRNATELYI